MTANQARAATLVSALRAGIERDREALGRLCADDVRVWTPTLATESLTELVDALDRRDEAFTAVELDVAPLDVGGDYACAEWTVEMTHTGTLTWGDDLIIEPSGIRVTLHGVTIAEFVGEKICSLRQYWDERAVLEQLGLLTRG